MRNSAAKRYAAALHALVVETKDRDKISQQLEQVADLWQQQPGFKEILLNPRLTQKQKRSFLSKIESAIDLQKPIANLLNLMLDKGRITSIPAVAREYQLLDDGFAGRVRALCRVAAPLSQQQFERLQQKLKDISGAEHIVVSIETDPSLLAGVEINIDGKVIDGSLRGRLQRLQHRLEHKQVN